MSSRTSSLSTLTTVPSTMSPSLKYLMVSSIAARKSSWDPMLLTATLGVVGWVSVLLVVMCRWAPGTDRGCGQRHERRLPRAARNCDLPGQCDRLRPAVRGPRELRCLTMADCAINIAQSPGYERPDSGSISGPPLVTPSARSVGRVGPASAGAGGHLERDRQLERAAHRGRDQLG